MHLQGLPFGSSPSLMLQKRWTFYALRRAIGWKFLKVIAKASIAFVSTTSFASVFAGRRMALSEWK